MFIFEEEKYFNQCHASTLTMMPDGRIMSAWFAGTAEGYQDTAIWGAFLSGKKWTEPSRLVKVNGLAHWNPVLFTTPQNKVILYFKTGDKPSSWKTWEAEIKDGKVVEDSIFMVKKDDIDDNVYPRGPVRCKPIVLSNGKWLAPSSVEKTIGYKMRDVPSLSGKMERSLVEWKSFVDISENNGITWKMSELIDFDREKFGEDGKYGGVIQPTVWESTNGGTHMFLRSTAEKIFRSDSCDYGKTWSMAYPTTLPNNNSGIDVSVFNGVLFLVYNPVNENWGSRTPISIKFSFDNGKMWLKDVDLEKDPWGSFSYPSVITIPNGIALTYTWNRRNIVYREFDVTFKNEKMSFVEVEL